MSRKMKCVICVLMVIGGAITGCGAEETVDTPVVMSPAQIKHQEMEDAAYYNSFVVVFDMNANGAQYAICNGTTRIVGLDEGETRRVELSSQEALNASLCKRSAETGNYSTVLDISGVNPGDYLVIGTSLQWTRYH